MPADVRRHIVLKNDGSNGALSGSWNERLEKFSSVLDIRKEETRPGRTVYAVSASVALFVLGPTVTINEKEYLMSVFAFGNLDLAAVPKGAAAQIEELRK